MDCFKPFNYIKINCDIQDEIELVHIHEMDLTQLRYAEDKITGSTITNIMLIIWYKNSNPRFLEEVFVLEGNYIAEFRSTEEISDKGTQELRAEHIYKILDQELNMINLIECRDRITQDELKQLALKSQRIL